MFTDSRPARTAAPPHCHPSGARDLPAAPPGTICSPGQVRLGGRPTICATLRAPRLGIALEPALLGTSLLGSGRPGSGRPRALRPVVESLCLQALPGGPRWWPWRPRGGLGPATRSTSWCGSAGPGLRATTSTSTAAPPTRRGGEHPRRGAWSATCPPRCPAATAAGRHRLAQLLGPYRAAQAARGSSGTRKCPWTAPVGAEQLGEHGGGTPAVHVGTSP